MNVLNFEQTPKATAALHCTVKVLSQETVAADIRRLTVQWPQEYLETPPAAGQFFMLRTWATEEAPMLSRPISVHNYDAALGQLTFLYQVKGIGTEKLAALQAGDTLTLTGPCGNGFAVPKLVKDYRKIAVVGGGIGVAPLLLLCRALADAGIKPDFYAGFREEPFALEAFAPVCGRIYLATDSGKAGFHGLVTGILHPEQYDVVLTCGPMPMMRGVAKLCEEKGTPCFASLERKMACGLGACLGCTCHTKVGAKTVCKDGPVFPAQEVFE